MCRTSAGASTRADVAMKPTIVAESSEKARCATILAESDGNVKYMPIFSYLDGIAAYFESNVKNTLDDPM